MSKRPLFGKMEALVEKRPDGSILVRNSQALPEVAPSMNERLHHWAKVKPDHTFLAQRASDGQWRKLTYKDTLQKVQNLASALLARNLSAERPVLIISGNSIEHALLGLACLEIGVPYCPLSTAYAQISQDFGKLKYAIELLTPGLVFAAEGKAFAKALNKAIPAGIEIVVADGNEAEFNATPFAAMLATKVSDNVAPAFAKVNHQTIAKFLLTSGSTGNPKAVTNTQGMICANQVMIRECMPFLKEQQPVLVDWLPWSHTFGGNHNFYMALYNGGSFYIDEGRPVPGAIEATVRNLKDVSPTIYFNVPKGYETLLPFLEKEASFRANFLKDLNLLFYAGAGLTKTVWDKLHDVTRAELGHHVTMTTSLGATETAPAALFNVREVEAPQNVGIPMPGTEIKLTPSGGKLELRLRGPNIMPGYWRKPDLSATAFDEEGYYKIGDALKPANPGNFSEGFIFDGRIAEDFKLDTGTWVSVGTLRTAFVNHFMPYVKDAAITGHDKADIGALVFPDYEALRPHAANPSATPAELATDSKLHNLLATRLASFAKLATGSSNRVARALLLVAPPSIDKGEITDKGSLNQRAVIANHAAELERLYTKPPIKLAGHP